MPQTVSWHGPFKKRVSAFVEDAGRVRDEDGEALHRTRVASRRLRELVPLLGLSRDRARRLGKRLREVTKRLGNVREFDVLLLMIAELNQKAEHPIGTLRRIEAEVQKSRTIARKRLASKLPPEKIEALAARLRRTAKRGKPNKPRGEVSRPRRPRNGWLLALEARIARRAMALRSAIDTAAGLYVPERLHAIRIAVKKLRYSAELLAEARNQPLTPDLESLRTAQDLLGRLQDREVLIDLTRRLQTDLSKSDLDGVHHLEAIAHQLEDDCRRIHADYVRDRAKLIAVAERIGDFKTGRVSEHRLAG